MHTYKISYSHNDFIVNHLSDIDLMTKRHWSKSRFYELEVLKTIKDNIRNGGIIIDGGANFGNHSIWFVNFCEVTKIFCIEAVTDVFNVLKDNVKNNNTFNIICSFENVALSDRDNQIATWGSIDYNNIGGTSMIIEDSVTNTDFVITKKLDSIVKPDEYDQITCIKLDIEGGEHRAIVGAEKVLTCSKPLLVCEAHTHKEFTNLDHLIKSIYPSYKYVLSLKSNTHFWMVK